MISDVMNDDGRDNTPLSFVLLITQHTLLLAMHDIIDGSGNHCKQLLLYLKNIFSLPLVCHWTTK